MARRIKLGTDAQRQSMHHAMMRTFNEWCDEGTADIFALSERLNAAAALALHQFRLKEKAQ